MVSTVSTSKGKLAINQDSFFAVDKDHMGLYVVADGMGGHEEGERASQLAVQNIKELWDSGFFETATVAQATDSFFTLFKDCNAQILKFNEIPEYISGTTCTALFIKDGSYCIAHVGDSRVYAISDSGANTTIQQLTEDHLSQKGKITSALGVSRRLFVYTTSNSIDNIKSFVICSDGLYKTQSTQDIQHILSIATNGAEQLVTKALNDGESDNVTAIVVNL